MAHPVTDAELTAAHSVSAVPVFRVCPHGNVNCAGVAHCLYARAGNSTLCPGASSPVHLAQAETRGVAA